MKELVEVMAKSLVSDPSAVTVEEETTGTTTVLRLHVAPEDMGKVIGKQGRIAKAIRSVMKAVATRENVKMKAKVTEDLKLKIIGDLQNTIKQMEADLNQFDFQAKQVMNQAANDLSAAPRLREQIEVERRKRTDAKAEAEEQLKQAQNLQLGAEIGYGTPLERMVEQNLQLGAEIGYGTPLERMVEVKVGDNLQALMGAEILTEDGKIIAFRM